MKFNYRISRLPVLCLVGAAMAACVAVPGAAQAAEKRTATGVVMEDTPGNAFLFRTDNGYSFRVVAKYVEPPRLSSRDTVRIYGNWQGNEFHASNVRILDQDVFQDINRRRKRTATGIVTYMMTGGFEMRMPNGRLMQVWARGGGGLPKSLSLADRVRAYGYVEGLLMQAQNIRVLRQGTIDDS